MVAVLSNSWALMLGLLLLMIGNGLQGTLLGVRGDLEGFSAFGMATLMSAYFAGFLAAGQLAPRMIRRVGHVRVFAALASLISAGFILFPLVPNEWAWAVFRFAIGFSFCGVYVVAESWLNAAATNETRGQALSVYVIVMMLGIILAQSLAAVGDPSTYALFIIISVLVSLSFLPILLSISPAPYFELARPMTLLNLYRASPLGIVSTFLTGGLFSAMFAMASVWGTAAGLTLDQIALFVTAIYSGGLICQYPIGWLSDRMDRRRLIVGLSGFAAAAILLSLPFSDSLMVLLVVGFILGGVANPIHGVIVAYVADYLEPDDMAAASGGLQIFNGLGAVIGPFTVSGAIALFGPNAYLGYCAALFLAIAGYALYRMTQRVAPSAEDTASYGVVYAQASPVAAEVAITLPSEEDEADRAA